MIKKIYDFGRIFYHSDLESVERPYLLICFMFLLSSGSGFTQQTIDGQVIDTKGIPLVGANVYLMNTLDGASSDVSGSFSFSTIEKGEHLLVVSSISYETIEIAINLDESPSNLTIVLEEAASNLAAVVVSAGTMEVNNEQEVAVLTTLDILTTAGAGADIAGAIRTLPGAQQNVGQTGLFVRGGDASEASFVIDGLTVQNPFQSDAPGVSQRSRFTPFQFKGVAFSSGGYSARFGQALSSVLELNTLDMPEQSTINLGINFASIGVSGSQLWDHSGFEAGVNYTNLTPFFKLADTNFEFYEIPEGFDISARFVQETGENGLFKAFVVNTRSKSGVRLPDPAMPGSIIPFSTDNDNTYGNLSYRYLGENWSLYSAASASHNSEDFGFGDIPLQNRDWRFNWRGETGFFPSESWRWLLGSEIQRFGLKQSFDNLSQKYDETIAAAYLEGEWRPRNNFAVKPGIRYEHSSYLQSSSLAPRLSMAFRTGEWSQISLASGLFYQNPHDRYLLRDLKPDFTKAVHYLANYQWLQSNKIFRVEGYHKTYSQLIRELEGNYDPNPYRFIFGPVDNTGDGYATGLDFFWRDRSTLKNLDYWISYSYIQTERDYANFPVKATPDFIADHTINLTTKYFIEAWQSNINVSYAFASGKPYYDPGDQGFLSNRTPAYQNFSLNFAYLTNIGKWFTVLYAGVDNITGHRNIFGYRYSQDGEQRYAIEPPIYRSFFIGMLMSLSEFSQDEL